jgi:hypothetical protein
MMTSVGAEIIIGNSGGGGTEVPPASPDIYNTAEEVASVDRVPEGVLPPTDRDVVLGGEDGMGRVSGMLVEDLVRYHHLLWTVRECSPANASCLLLANTVKSRLTFCVAASRQK